MNIRTAKEDFCPLQILEGNLWKESTLDRTMLRRTTTSTAEHDFHSLNAGQENNVIF